MPYLMIDSRHISFYCSFDLFGVNMLISNFDIVSFVAALSIRTYLCHKGTLNRTSKIDEPTVCVIDKLLLSLLLCCSTGDKAFFFFCCSIVESDVNGPDCFSFSFFLLLFSVRIESACLEELASSQSQAKFVQLRLRGQASRPSFRLNIFCLTDRH